MNTVKEITTDGELTGYLVDGNLNVPIATGNRHYQAVQEWIAEGNTPSPADVVEVDLVAQTNAEARAYLAETDWYAIRESETGEPMPEDIKTKRAEERLKVVHNG